MIGAVYFFYPCIWQFGEISKVWVVWYVRIRTISCLLVYLDSDCMDSVWILRLADMRNAHRLASTPTPGWEMAAAGRGEHPPQLPHPFPIPLNTCQPTPPGAPYKPAIRKNPTPFFHFSFKGRGGRQVPLRAPAKHRI